MRRFQHILVTGGAGFIGSNYVHYLLGHHPAVTVSVLDKLTYAGNLENLADVRDRITFIEGDIACPETVGEALRGVDAVVNFAAESHVDRSLVDSQPFVDANVVGVFRLLEAARRQGLERFLQVSTDEVYGDLVGSIHHSLETDAFRPRSPYAATKAGAEHLVESYATSYGIDAVTTRGANTYGPYQYPEKIIPLFITNAIEDSPLPLYGDGSAVRDYLHVEDHCAGIDLVLHEGLAGEAYNLGARLQMSGVEVAEAILDILGKPRELIEFVADRPGHDYRYSVDPEKAERLGWTRRWNFEEGLAETARWYQTHESWWRRIRAGRSRD